MDDGHLSLIITLLQNWQITFKNQSCNIGLCKQLFTRLCWLLLRPFYCSRQQTFSGTLSPARSYFKVDNWMVKTLTKNIQLFQLKIHQSVSTVLKWKFSNFYSKSEVFCFAQTKQEFVPHWNLILHPLLLVNDSALVVLGTIKLDKLFWKWVIKKSQVK